MHTITLVIRNGQATNTLLAGKTWDEVTQWPWLKRPRCALSQEVGILVLTGRTMSAGLASPQDIVRMVSTKSSYLSSLSKGPFQ